MTSCGVGVAAIAHELGLPVTKPSSRELSMPADCEETMLVRPAAFLPSNYTAGAPPIVADMPIICTYRPCLENRTFERRISRVAPRDLSPSMCSSSTMQQHRLPGQNNLKVRCNIHSCQMCWQEPCIQRRHAKLRGRHSGPCCK